MRSAVLAWKTDGYTNKDIKAWDLYAKTIKKSASGYNIFTSYRINTEKEGKTWTKLKNCNVYDVTGGSFKVDIDIENDLSGILYLGTSKYSMLKEFEGIFSVNKYTFTVTGLSKQKRYYFYIKNTSIGEEGKTGIYCQKTEIKVPLDIDIGCPAVHRENVYSGNQYTVINQGNPANESGKITSVEIYPSDEIDFREVTVAIFYLVNGNILSTRDYIYIGDVQKGEKRTFAVDLTVEKGDFIGVVGEYDTKIKNINHGGDNTWFQAGKHIPCTNEEFEVDIGWMISLYGTGKTIL